jgi:homotetrameric cytidine deaminase
LTGDPYQELVAEAWRAMRHAHAPYVPVRVGAALLAASGVVYLGANVQNAALSAGICAERAALFAAVSRGERQFSALAVVGDQPVTPCGVCLQALAEFAPELPIILAWEDVVERTSLDRLMPRPFHLSSTRRRPQAFGRDKP